MFDVIFFFSSRRRHTRWPRDWSSDVCSSDLAGRTSTESADKIIAFVREQALDVEWILETHVHADHLSAAPYLQQALGGKLGIGANITKVQELFGQLFNEGTEFRSEEHTSELQSRGHL